MLLAALILDFPAGLASWFSLVPMPLRLSGAVAAGAVVDFLLCYQWEALLRLRVSLLDSHLLWAPPAEGLPAGPRGTHMLMPPYCDCKLASPSLHATLRAHLS